MNLSQVQELLFEGISDLPRLMEDRAGDASNAGSSAADGRSQEHVHEHAVLLGKRWPEQARPEHTHVEGQNTKHQVCSKPPRAEGRKKSGRFLLARGVETDNSS